MSRISMTLEEVRSYQQEGYRMIPIYTELLSDFITPIELMRKLKAADEHCFLLESVVNQEVFGRYTFLGYAPKLDLVCTDGRLLVKDTDGTVLEEIEDANPGDYIRGMMKNYRSPKLKNLPSFTGGLVGYFSYDYIKYSEPRLRKCLDGKKDDFQDLDLMLFDRLIAFDNIGQRMYLIVNVFCGDKKALEDSYSEACNELMKMKKLVEGPAAEQNRQTSGRLLSEFRPYFDEDAFSDMVQKAKHYIYEGDIFQVVLSNRLEADFEGSLFDTYRVLRGSNPSPYMFYFSGDQVEVAGASPETLVKLENGELHTFPLAGTRPRGSSEEEDRRLEKELLGDEKERAEHNMLVDLGRNDLGRISSFGSVTVEHYMDILRYSHVMHIGSTVRGQLKEGLEAIDAVNAVLPAGTLSGAPKIRACEIIDELEHSKRGIYGGAIGYLDFTGNLDTCIAIRIAYKVGTKLYIRSGAGIVADSVPANEYRECINKAKAVVRAVEMTKEVIGDDFAD